MRRLALTFVAATGIAALPLLAQDAAEETPADAAEEAAVDAAVEAVDEEETQRDRSLIEGFLEDNLSGAGREIRIIGFEGALRSTARLEELTIADDDGVWLSLRDVTLDWQRAALLRGNLQVNSLTAGEIEVLRRPLPQTDLPESTASQFRLPELPVSIEVDEVRAETVTLGADVIGTPAQFTIEGAASLGGGEGTAQIALQRIDGALGEVTLAGAYSNETRILSLDLSLAEGPEGIVAGLIDLPGAPAIDLAVTGEGPVDDYTAEISLATDGEPRVEGTVTAAVPELPESGAAIARRDFTANLAGDISPLFLPEYRDFFGPDVALSVEGSRYENGVIRLGDLSLDTRSLVLDGAVTINGRGWPERVDLAARLADPEAGEVLLPISGPETWVNSAALSVRYDARSGTGWDATVALDGFRREDMALESATIEGSGTLVPGGGDEGGRFGGRFDLAAAGIDPGDEALSEAIGDTLDGTFRLNKQGSGPVRISDMDLSGEDYGLGGRVTLGGDFAALDLLVDADVDLRADDLSRVSALAGRPVSGAVNVAITAEAAVPGGAFDVTVAGTGDGLGIDDPRVDAILAGRSRLDIEVARDTEGTTIRRLEVDTAGGDISASGLIAPDNSALTARVRLDDAGLALEGLSGPLEVNAQAAQDGLVWDADVSATGPGGADVTLDVLATLTEQGAVANVGGDVTARVEDLSAYAAALDRDLAGQLDLTASGSGVPESGSFDVTGDLAGRGLATGLAEVDRLLAGNATVAFALRRNEAGTFFIDALDAQTDEVTATITGTTTDEIPAFEADVTLRDLGLLVPDLSGAFTVAGTGRLVDGTWQLDVDGTGPGGTQLAVEGGLAEDFSAANLDVSGRAPLQFANPFIAPRQAAGFANFDLAVNGPLALQSVSGRVSSSDAVLALPLLRFSLDPVRLDATLSGGRAQIDVTARSTAGGRITAQGGIGLTAPYSGDLRIGINNLALSDPRLYNTSVNGDLTLNGPLTGGARIGGRIDIGPTEIQVPDSGFGVADMLPNLTHVNEPGDVYATRARAGLVGGDSGADGGGGPAYELNLNVNAPSQIFVRGRGLDAELGGTLRLRGTTDQIISQGGFSLIRGRLDILGKRLTLTEGTATLEGDFNPVIRLVAETASDDGTQIYITVEGTASAPDVTFTSSPALPDDEVLARLIFGNSIEEITPIQALRLAAAVAQLAGQGGAGIVGNLRQNFGLDDLDVTTGEDGAIGVTAGRYITENLYTDVQVNSEGTAEVELNLSITPSLTARGSAGSDGETGVGIFFERDY